MTRREARRDDAPMHLRMPSRWLLVVLAMGVALTAVVQLFPEPGAPGPSGASDVALGGLILASVWVALRYARMDVFINEDDEVVIRNAGRTYRVPRAQVVGAEVGSRGNVTGAVDCLIVVTRDGRRIRAISTAAYSRPAVQRMRDKLAARLNLD